MNINWWESYGTPVGLNEVRVSVSATGSDEPIITVDYVSGKLRMDADSAQGLVQMISDAIAKAKLLRGVVK